MCALGIEPWSVRFWLNVRVRVRCVVVTKGTYVGAVCMAALQKEEVDVGVLLCDLPSLAILSCPDKAHSCLHTQGLLGL